MVFPEDGITKGQVVDHYQRVSGSMLPYVAGRALTVERYPKGIGGQGFMQKNVPDHYPDFIARHETPKEGGGITVYPVIDSTEAVLFYANHGVITFHAPPVKVEDTSHPDWVIWDLDPPPGRVDLVRQAAAVLGALLESHGILTFPMTSGSKGYHLRARLVPNLEGDVVADVARGIAAIGSGEHPDLLTLAFRKKERGDRVFVDWLRNAPYSTAVAPWSLRPRDGAPVATPLAWDEVATIEPDGIRLGDVAARLAADPGEGMPVLDHAPASESVGRALEEAEIVLEPFDRFRP